MKYILLPFIALGLVLSMAVGIEYTCQGSEVFPTFYGSPFVFKRTSLGSSMEYYFSVGGLMLNVVVWSTVLWILDRLIQRWIRKWKEAKWMLQSYKAIIGVMIAFTSMVIWFNVISLGRGCDEHSNYWYWNVDQEAEQWGMDCEGNVVFLAS